MEEKYMSLITDYLDGTLSASGKKEFESYVAEGHIDLKEVESMRVLSERLEDSSTPAPSDQLGERFYVMLAQEKQNLAEPQVASKLSTWGQKLFQTHGGRLAFAMSILFIGVLLGRVFSGSVYNEKLDTLSDQMADMQEVVMMTMLEKRSVSSRLKGVQMSNGMVSKNEEVTNALFLTLNNDESTNVRLAALATLSEYAADPAIREGLVNSITQQESPLVQVALAELMVELQESQAIKEFESILNKKETPDDVKTVLRQNLEKIM